MMSFKLRINGDIVAIFEVVNIKPMSFEGWFVYEWSAWKSDGQTYHMVAKGQLTHPNSEDAEDLALKVLTHYRQSKLSQGA